MLKTKKDILQLIEAMPEDISLLDVIEELSFRAKVDEGLAALDRGEWVSDQEARKRLRKWQNSGGQT